MDCPKGIKSLGKVNFIHMTRRMSKIDSAENIICTRHIFYESDIFYSSSKSQMIRS